MHHSLVTVEISLSSTQRAAGIINNNSICSNNISSSSNNISSSSNNISSNNSNNNTNSSNNNISSNISSNINEVAIIKRLKGASILWVGSKEMSRLILGSVRRRTYRHGKEVDSLENKNIGKGIDLVGEITGISPTKGMDKTRASIRSKIGIVI